MCLLQLSDVREHLPEIRPKGMLRDANTSNILPNKLTCNLVLKPQQGAGRALSHAAGAGNASVVKVILSHWNEGEDMVNILCPTDDVDCSSAIITLKMDVFFVSVRVRIT
jgi:hypothetical protein